MTAIKLFKVVYFWFLSIALVDSQSSIRSAKKFKNSDYIPYDTQIIQRSSCIGLNGTCSPTWCKNVDNPACTNPHEGETVHMADYLKSIPCKICKQSTNRKCSTEYLTSLTKSLNAGIGSLAALYCNDKFLVIQSTGSPNHEVGLKYIPQPPGEGGVPYSEACVTRSYSEAYCSYKIPLNPQLLPLANKLNNAQAFIGQTNPAAIPGYGLPDSGNLAVSITGLNIFPLFNNEGVISNERCEVDKCSAHAGQGFDYHYHGDPFSWDNGTCLYSPLDYESNSAHPPLIGWSLDGFSIYGRHLYESNLGYNISLDICGGHIHQDANGIEMEYHYHTQVQYKISDEAVAQSGENYYAYVPGVFNCWRGNISVDDFFVYKEEDYQPCCNSTEAFLAEGMELNISYASPTSVPTLFSPTNPPKPTDSSNSPTMLPSKTTLPTKSQTYSPTESSKSSPPPSLPPKPPTMSPSSSPTISPSKPLPPPSLPPKPPTTSPSIFTLPTSYSRHLVTTYFIITVFCFFVLIVVAYCYYYLNKTKNSLQRSYERNIELQKNRNNFKKISYAVLPEVIIQSEKDNLNLLVSKGIIEKKIVTPSEIVRENPII